MDSSFLNLPPLSNVQDVLNQQIAHAQQLQNAQNTQLLQDANFAQQNVQSLHNMLPPISMSKPSKHEKAIDLLKMRMGGVLKEFHLTNEEFLICHVYKDTVFVFFVARGVAGNLEESVNVFPSDKLIAQLRLLWI